MLASGRGTSCFQGAHGLHLEGTGTLEPQPWPVGDAPGGTTSLHWLQDAICPLFVSLCSCVMVHRGFFLQITVWKVSPGVDTWRRGRALLGGGREGKGGHTGPQSSGWWATTWPFQSKDEIASRDLTREPPTPPPSCGFSFLLFKSQLKGHFLSLTFQTSAGHPGTS